LAAVNLRRRDPALRVLVSVSSTGQGRLFREIIAEADERLPAFADSLLDFLAAHDFDGAEIDWTGGSVEALKLLLRGLRGPFAERGLSLGLALGPEQLADAELAALADLLVLRAWHSKRPLEFAQSPAPLAFAQRFVDTLTRNGVPTSKIILGLPLFGWTYKLANKNEGSLNLAYGYGLEGRYTKQKGQLAYFEVGSLILAVFFSTPLHPSFFKNVHGFGGGEASLPSLQRCFHCTY
jgi:hypothetical protein